MLYTPMTKKAIAFAYLAHKDQKDRSGLPYVFHPFHVAEMMNTEEETCTALLHDVLEDTSYTIKDLRQAGFSEDILVALNLLTHQKNIPYMDYIKKLKKNPIARKVKIADLIHNSDLGRLDMIDEWAIKHMEKYKIARKYLEKED